MSGSVPPKPPFLPHPPLITPKIKVLEIMPMWVFRQAQKFGKLPEAWFQVSAKLRLGSSSDKFTPLIGTI